MSITLTKATLTCPFHKASHEQRSKQSRTLSINRSRRTKVSPLDGVSSQKPAHPRVGTKFKWRVPGHLHDGKFGTITNVLEDIPPRLHVTVRWDNTASDDVIDGGPVSMAKAARERRKERRLSMLSVASNGVNADRVKSSIRRRLTEQLEPAGTPRGSVLDLGERPTQILDASNHTIALSYEGYKKGDVVALATDVLNISDPTDTTPGFDQVTVVQRICYSRYLVQSGLSTTQCEVDFNQGNSYRPILTNEEYTVAHQRYTERTLAENTTVVDGITSVQMDVALQTVSIAMATECAAHQHRWAAQVDMPALTSVRALVDAFCQTRNSIHITRLFTIVANAGAGKTWLVTQALYYLLLEHRKDQQQLALCLSVQSLAFEIAKHKLSKGQQPSDYGGDVIEWYLAVAYTTSTWLAVRAAVSPSTPGRTNHKNRDRDLLLDAYHSRRLVLILDGLDEAPALKSWIQDFICGPLALSGTKVLVSSRPEGIDEGAFQLHGFVQLRLLPYSEAQQRAILRCQLADRGERSAGKFMSNLLDYVDTKKQFQHVYDTQVQDGATRNQLENLQFLDVKVRQTICSSGSSVARGVASADELLYVARACHRGVFDILRAIAANVGIPVFECESSLQSAGMVGLLLAPIKTKDRIQSKALLYSKNSAGKNSADGAPFSKIMDALRCRFICETASQMHHIVQELETEASIAQFLNLFAPARLDEINYRRLQITACFNFGATLSHCVEVQIHLRDIYQLRVERADLAYAPYRYFQKMFPEASSAGRWVLLDQRLATWSAFLDVPVVMSMMVAFLTHFDFTNPRLEDLPNSKSELYRLGLQTIVEHRLAHLSLLVTLTRSGAMGFNAVRSTTTTAATSSKGPKQSGGLWSQDDTANSSLPAKSKWHGPVIRALAAIAFANQKGSAAGDGARRQFTLKDMQEAVGLASVGNTLSSSELQILNKDFKAADANGDGLISFTEFEAMMKKQGMKDCVYIQEAFAAIDRDGEGQIQYSEFIATAQKEQESLGSDLALGMIVLGRLMFDFDPKDAYRVPTLKVLESGGGRHAESIKFQSTHLSMQEAWVVMHLHINKESCSKVLSSWDDTMEFFSTCSPNLISLLTENVMNAIGKRVAPDGVLNLSMRAEKVSDGELQLVGKLRRLTNLNLSKCLNITDAGLAHVGKLQHLIQLNLQGCTAIGLAGLQSLSHMEQLSELSLPKTNRIPKYRGTGIEYIRSLPVTQDLDLSHCSGMIDADLACINSLQQLTALDLYNCRQITDTALMHVGKLHHLTSLDLSGCRKITDAGLVHVGKLQRLTTLNLYVIGS